MSSHEVDSHPTVIRHEVSVWQEITSYLETSSDTTGDCRTKIPFVVCGLCRGELDIQGIPPTTEDEAGHQGCVTPCGHMFGVTCLTAWFRTLPEPTRQYIGQKVIIPRAIIQGMFMLVAYLLHHFCILLPSCILR